MANRAGSTGIDAALYRREGPWCTAFVDASLGTTAAKEAADALPEKAAQLLASQRADEGDIAAMRAALLPAQGLASPAARFVAINKGEIVLDEVLPGVEAGAPRVDCGPFPNLVPLARTRGGQFPYVVAEVGRDGGEVRLRHSAAAGVAEVRRVASNPDEAHHARKVPDRYGEPQNRANTEEIWRRNADELAKQIDDVVRDSGARLVVLSGDVKARELVLSQLAEASRAIATTVDQHTRTGGADANIFTAEIETKVAQAMANDIRDLSDKISNRLGSGRGGLALGLNEVVTALQQAQADLVLVAQYQDNATLRALTAEPWLDTDDSSEHAELVAGSWPAPEVLLRAVALTDATIRYVPDGVLPYGTGVAALLRWQNGEAY
ncbi:hypothetical protein GCM10023081_30480 [Arthrobacter ginkgonis]|uniref:Peptide chain release factor 2 n=1 Tax=Arthrobacter ginkgonis TaxID=1630594 RepID=A0ABP7CLQ5_9MICC